MGSFSITILIDLSFSRQDLRVLDLFIYFCICQYTSKKIRVVSFAEIVGSPKIYIIFNVIFLKVYVTVNVILKSGSFSDTEKLNFQTFTKMIATHLNFFKSFVGYNSRLQCYVQLYLRVSKDFTCNIMLLSIYIRDQICILIRNIELIEVILFIIHELVLFFWQPVAMINTGLTIKNMLFA